MQLFDGGDRIQIQNFLAYSPSQKIADFMSGKIESEGAILAPETN